MRQKSGAPKDPAKKVVQHDPDLLLGRVLLVRLTADVVDDLQVGASRHAVRSPDNTRGIAQNG